MSIATGHQINFPKTIKILEEVTEDLKTDTSTPDLVKLSTSSILEYLRQSFVQLVEMENKINAAVTYSEFSKAISNKVGLDELSVAVAKLIGSEVARIEKKLRSRVEDIVDKRVEEVIGRMEERMVQAAIERAAGELANEMTRREKDIIRSRDKSRSGSRKKTNSNGHFIAVQTPSERLRSERINTKSSKRSDGINRSRSPRDKGSVQSGKNGSPEQKEGSKGNKLVLKDPSSEDPILEQQQFVQQNTMILDEEFRKQLIVIAETLELMESIPDRVSILEELIPVVEQKDMLIMKDYQTLNQRLAALEEFQNATVQLGMSNPGSPDNRGQSTPNSIASKNPRAMAAMELWKKYTSQGQKTLEQAAARIDTLEGVVAELRKDKEKVEASIREVVESKWQQWSLAYGQQPQLSNAEILTLLKELSNCVDGLRGKNEGLRSQIEKRMEHIETVLDKKIKSFSLDKLKDMETIRTEFSNLLTNTSDKQEKGFDMKIKLLSEDIGTLHSKIETLKEDQDSFCKESSNLMTQIFYNDREKEGKFLIVEQKLMEFEKVVQNKDTDSQETNNDEYATRADLLNYFSEIKRRVDMKAELGEVQVAMDSMQKKLNLTLAKNYGHLLDRIEFFEAQIESVPTENEREDRASFVQNISRSLRKDRSYISGANLPDVAKSHSHHSGGKREDEEMEVRSNKKNRLQPKRQNNEEAASDANGSRIDLNSTAPRELIDEIIQIKEVLMTKCNNEDMKTLIEEQKGALATIHAKLECKMEPKNVEEMILRETTGRLLANFRIQGT
jgi:hypothetical protein